MSYNERTEMRGFVDCVTCGRSPSQLFRNKRSGKHYCKECLDLEYKKTPKVKLKAVPDATK